jgi:hypothetical protein
MATQQFTVEDDRYQQEPPARGKNWLKGCLLGCLGAVVVLLIVGIVATIWISRNWRTWFTAGATEAVHQAVDSSQLPAEEKNQIKSDIDRFFVAFREGQVSMEQFGQLVQKFVDSPLMTAFVASAVETKYLDASGLSDEEKAEAKVTLQRFLRGAIDNKINQQAMDAALRHVADKQSDGNWQFREKVSDAEIREFLAEAKKAADEAQVPEQPEQFDPSDEVKRIIDETMAAPAVPPPAETAPPLEIPPPAEEAPKPEAESATTPEAEDEPRDVS